MLASLTGIGCGAQPAGRYVAERDPGASVRIEYVRDRVTGQWAYREFELRVDTARVLPEPLRHPDRGDGLSVQLFGPGVAKSGGLRDIEPRIDGAYRVWSGADMMYRPDIDGHAAYGVQLEWYVEGEPTRKEPMEVFPMPALGETEPGEWSRWFSASSLRPGAFAWWEEVHGTPVDSLPKPEYPFEMRWRIVLDEVAGRIR